MSSPDAACRERLVAGGPGVLRPEEVHVWYVLSDRVTDPRLLERYAALLAPEERARHDRFVFARDRQQFLVTRGVVRTLLGGYLDIEPAACAFVADRYGRPSLRADPAGETLAFNLSHTRGLVACAVARIPEIGVDVEDVERTAVSPDLPDRFFSAAEVRALNALPETAPPSRFFDYWTLKEAYIKARGLGLSLPLDGFSIHLETAGPPRISFAAAIADDPGTWQFAQFDPSPRHRLAVAVRRRGPDLAIRIRELVPAL
jgi:4'-phosphopantetheinyl transferase